MGASLLPPRLPSSLLRRPPRHSGSRRLQEAVHGVRAASAESTGPIEDCWRLGPGQEGVDSGRGQLSLSLFCVDYYERLGRLGGGGDASGGSSLMFLCKPVNV
ncbi:F-box protein [Salix suchowensis]|nr:F-box protein [Salix suchowensis]